MEQLRPADPKTRIVNALSTLRKVDPKSVASTEALVRQMRDPHKASLRDLTSTCLDLNLTLWQSQEAKNDQVATAVDELRELVLQQETF